MNYRNKETSKFVDFQIKAVQCILGSRKLNLKKMSIRPLQFNLSFIYRQIFI